MAQRSKETVEWFMSVTAPGYAGKEKPTPAWKILRQHPVQQRYLASRTRFNVVPAGRRSGKTMCSKRRLVRKAMSATGLEEGTLFVACAPTQQQAKRLYWRDLRTMTPEWFMASRPSKSELQIELKNNAIIMVAGLDEPARIEGVPIGHIILDEVANMRAEAWPEHIRPALGDTRGSADFIGVPEGRNHYWDLYDLACRDTRGEWATFHWFSSDILPKEEIDSWKATMDARTYRQEAEGSFETWGGRLYYDFNKAEHCRHLEHDPNLPLIFCFDFNVSPGCCVVAQEFPATFDSSGNVSRHEFTGVIGEVWIPDDSNTVLVCKRLIEDWGYRHKTERVICYGDPTGGARKTSGIDGTDWALIRRMLSPEFRGFSIKKRAPGLPAVRDRINAMNARIKSIDSTVRLRIDPEKAKNTVRDLDSMAAEDDGSESPPDKWSGHLSAALGYYTEFEHSLSEHFVHTRQF